MHSATNILSFGTGSVDLQLLRVPVQMQHGAERGAVLHLTDADLRAPRIFAPRAVYAFSLDIDADRLIKENSSDNGDHKQVGPRPLEMWLYHRESLRCVAETLPCKEWSTPVLLDAAIQSAIRQHTAGHQPPQKTKRDALRIIGVDRHAREMEVYHSSATLYFPYYTPVSRSETAGSAFWRSSIRLDVAHIHTAVLVHWDWLWSSMVFHRTDPILPLHYYDPLLSLFLSVLYRGQSPGDIDWSIPSHAHGRHVIGMYRVVEARAWAARKALRRVGSSPTMDALRLATFKMSEDDTPREIGVCVRGLHSEVVRPMSDVLPAVPLSIEQALLDTCLVLTHRPLAADMDTLVAQRCAQHCRWAQAICTRLTLAQLVTRTARSGFLYQNSLTHIRRFCTQYPASALEARVFDQLWVTPLALEATLRRTREFARDLVHCQYRDDITGHLMRVVFGPSASFSALGLFGEASRRIAVSETDGQLFALSDWCAAEGMPLPAQAVAALAEHAHDSLSALRISTDCHAIGTGRSDGTVMHSLNTLSLLADPAWFEYDSALACPATDAPFYGSQDHALSWYMTARMHLQLACQPRSWFSITPAEAKLLITYTDHSANPLAQNEASAHAERSLPSPTRTAAEEMDHYLSLDVPDRPAPVAPASPPAPPIPLPLPSPPRRLIREHKSQPSSAASSAIKPAASRAPKRVGRATARMNAIAAVAMSGIGRADTAKNKTIAALSADL